MSIETSPLSNHLLVALPSLHDPQFERSVTLVCQHDGDGAMGVVVNRASEYTLGEVLRQMGIASEDEALQSQIVLAGGPVHPERGFVLHDGAQAWDSSLEIADGLYLTTSRDILEAMAVGIFLPMGPLAGYFKLQALPPLYFVFLPVIYWLTWR